MFLIFKSDNRDKIKAQLKCFFLGGSSFHYWKVSSLKLNPVNTAANQLTGSKMDLLIPRL